MGKLVVSDTNIFIDLIDMGLLGDFFLLPFDISTVDFVIRELNKTGQRDSVMAFEARKRLSIVDKLEELFGKNRRLPEEDVKDLVLKWRSLTTK